MDVRSQTLTYNPSAGSIIEQRSPARMPLHSDTTAGDYAVFAKRNGQTVRHGSAGYQRPGHARRPRIASHSFAPLSPIIASPITTPTTSMSSNTFYIAPDKDSAKEMLTALQGIPLQRDYLTKGLPMPLPVSRETVVRVVDVYPTWKAIPPTPPPKSNLHRLASLDARRVSASGIPPSASLPASSNTHATTKTYTPRRRSSMPLMSLTKPLPATPPTPPSPSFGNSAEHNNLRKPTVNVTATAARAASQHKPIFHVADGGSDREDDEQPWTDSPQEYVEAEGTMDDAWLKEQLKDNLRRYHVLTELLTTEVGYLRDLRELIMGYIRQLPTLNCRPATMGNHFGSASNLSISPFTRSPTTATFPSCPITSTNASSLDGPPNPHKDKHTSRYMFSDKEIDLVTRNVEDIFHFHLDFVDDLRMVLEPLGFSVTSDRSESTVVLHSKEKKGIGPPVDALEAAIAAVTSEFKSQAAGFELYETFCAGHTEAFDLVRKLQQTHGVEWDAFEQRASHMVADMRKPTAYSHTVEGEATTLPVEEEELLAALRRRRHSLSSLDVSARLPRAQNMRSNLNLQNTLTVPDGSVGRDKSARLLFMDYLIKPVQRICKYPLLLEQLKVGKSFSQHPESTAQFSGAVDSNIAVEVAAQAMKNVAASVDEARRRRDISTKSSLVATRILNACVTQTSSSLRVLVGHTISSVFINSLGTCLFAGSLDVIHYYVDKVPGSSGTVKAKYLGAFLYMGGYLILVKVNKGKLYEPRHWFSLTGFELVDVPDEESILPCSFRLSHRGHLLDMAAACQREKDLWLVAIRESFNHRPTWINEPVSSLNADSRSDYMTSKMDDGKPDIPPVPPLPAIQSIPESDAHHYDSAAPAVVRTGDIISTRRPDILVPSRRSSTASVKAIFSATSDTTILIRRASPTARVLVEQGLLDVFSDMCLTARFRASTHDEELFQAPKTVRLGFSRSSSGLGMAGMGVAAKNRLTKRESVLVHRRTSGIDGYGHVTDVEVQQLGVAQRNSSAKSVASRRQAKKLKIVSQPLGFTSESEYGVIPDSPPALSHCSSASCSNAGSAGNSPIRDSASLRPAAPKTSANLPRPDLLVVQEADYLQGPQRSRSMVEGVKEMLHSRSLSPASSASGHHSLPPLSPNPKRSPSNFLPNYNLFKRFSGSLRRRVQSTPNVPDEEPLREMFSGAAAASESIKSTAVRRNKTTTERSGAFLSASESGQLRAYSGLKQNVSSESQRPTPVRRRSLFSPSTSRRQMMASTGDEPVPSLKRNLSFLHRFSPLNSTVVASSLSNSA